MRWGVCLAMGAALLVAAAEAGDPRPAVADLKQLYPDVRVVAPAGRVSRLWGPAFGFAATPEAAADRFLRAHSRVFGVSYDALAPEGTQDVMSGQFTAVYYRQQYNGVPVDRAWLTVLVRHDVGNGIVLVSPHVFDLSAAELRPFVITPAEAIAAVQARYPDYTFEAAELVVFVDERGEEPVPLYAYRFIGGNNDIVHPEKYEFMVDAASVDGAIVHLETRILEVDISGQVTGMGTGNDLPDRADNPPTQLALEDLRVRIVSGNTGTTGATGSYTIANSGSSPRTVQTSLGGSGSTQAGRWVYVINAAGSVTTYSQTVTPPGPANFLVNPTPSEFTTAQVNGFYWTTATHNFVKDMVSTYPGIDTQLPCRVNIGDTCNAYYDWSSINFFQAGGGCPNTAYSSVVAHEYGHHVIAKGHSGASGAFHEGMADVTAMFLLDTHCLGRGFLGGYDCLRSGYNDVVYPCYGEVHYCGQVLSGAFWLLRDELYVTEPADYLQIAATLAFNTILLRPAIDRDITIDVLTLDDDDANLTNGTPHYPEISRAFGAKNLAAPPIEVLEFTYPNGRPAFIRPDGLTKMRVQVAPREAVPQPNTGYMHWTIDNAFIPVPMQRVGGDNVYDAVFPDLIGHVQACGGVVRYFVSADTTDGVMSVDPGYTVADSYSTILAYYMDTQVDDNFETDQGWTVVNEGVSDAAWERGVPTGNGGAHGDPPTDFDGSGACWVTGNGVDQDLDGGPTRLVSPTYDLSADGLYVVRYARWFYNDDNDADRLVVEISNNNGGSWVTAESVGHQAGWVTKSFNVATYVTPTAQVKLRFSATDNPNNSITEAAIDALQIDVTGCAPRIEKGDMDCDGLVNSGDIGPFVMALLEPDEYVAAYPDCDISNGDINEDGLVNAGDIAPFVELLTGGG